MVSGTATTKGSIKMVDIGGGNDVSAGGQITFRKHVNGIKLAASLTEETLKDHSSWRDVVLTADKDLGSNMKSSFEYDAGKRQAKLTGTWESDARDVKLKGVWVEKSNAFKGEAAVVLDDWNRVGATYDFSGRKAVGSYTHSQGSSDLTLKHHFDGGAWTVIAATKKGKDVYKVEYDTAKSGVLLEYGRKPYKVVAKGKLDGGMKDMSAVVTYERVINL